MIIELNHNGEKVFTDKNGGDKWSINRKKASKVYMM
jgi:hypothetical protein